MTPAEWLAALLLVWVVGAGIWQAVDSPVERHYNSYFYLLLTTGIECSLLFLSLSVLGAATGWYIAVGVIAALNLFGVFRMIATGDRDIG